MADEAEVTWTPEELREFDDLTMKLSSKRQMDRIEARLDLPKFMERVGKEKCDAMFAYLMKRDGKK